MDGIIFFTRDTHSYLIHVGSLVEFVLLSAAKFERFVSAAPLRAG